MRKSTNLSEISIILLVFIGILVVLKSIFVWRGERLRDVVYKSDNLIVQTLEKGRESNKELLVIGNGWNVSVNDNNQVIEHDPFFLISNAEAGLLAGNGYEIITAYFPFECSGLEDAGKELARFINIFYKGYRVILVGHSKSGVCFANLSKWLEANKENATIITVSSPYGGVKSDEENLQKLNRFRQWLYPKIIVPHKTNDDVTIHSVFLNEVADFSGLETREFYCVRSVLPERIYDDPLSLVLKWTDKKFEIEGDGMVGYAEQHPPIKPKEEFIVQASHQASMQEAIKLLKSKGIL